MRQTVVITGASSGIGRDAARVFVENGYRVFGISRNPGNVEGVTYVSADLTDDGSVAKAFDAIKKESDSIDILINNAGIGVSGAVEFTEMEDAVYQLDLNFFGCVRCIRNVLEPMRNHGGKIINISSVAAIYSLPFQAFYSASKSAVNALTMSIRNELTPFPNIQVAAIMPGDVKTDFTSARRKNNRGDDIYGGIISGSMASMEEDETTGMNSEAMSRYIYKIAVKKRLKPFYTGGGRFKLFVFLKRLLPESFIAFALQKLYIKKI